MFIRDDRGGRGKEEIPRYPRKGEGGGIFRRDFRKKGEKRENGLEFIPNVFSMYVNACRSAAVVLLCETLKNALRGTLFSRLERRREETGTLYSFSPEKDYPLPRGNRKKEGRKKKVSLFSTLLLPPLPSGRDSGGL